MYEMFLKYAPVPSYIIILMAAIVLVLWTLGTDLYDSLHKKISEIEDNTEFFGACVIHVVLAVLLTILFLLWGDVAPPLAFFYALWSGWLCIVILLISLGLLLELLLCIRNWCLEKRGKK